MQFYFLAHRLVRKKTTAFVKILQNCASFKTNSELFPYWNIENTGNVQDMGGKKSPSMNELQRQQSEKLLMRFSKAASPHRPEERVPICGMRFLLTSKACSGTEGSCLYLAVGINRLLEHLVINGSFLAISVSR